MSLISFFLIFLNIFVCSENISKRFQISRHDQDDFAFNSHKKAAKATRSEQFKLEIVPVGSISEDDGKKYLRSCIYISLITS